MIIEGQKFSTQKKYMQTMGVFDDWMKERNYAIENIMNQKILFIHTEFKIWLAGTKRTKPSLVKRNAFSHIWNGIGFCNFKETHYTCDFEPPDHQFGIREYMGY
ncbi:MAG: hypothetical protein EZS28_050778 [Streblomastix strix]|uniref:Uncharacterized protein n=1 Tax=Streblomastix strix TaxID=222440 RepID=A0A5J4T5M3_9EUKA|nr:MAG: hypothetical protein EZS28_050778 [Streblomastix strix]